MIQAWSGKVHQRSTLKWSGRLGLFSETTTAQCQQNPYNQDACYTICASIGIGGWGALLVWPCVNQCMVEACGAGILVDHTQMQKVGAKVSPCFNACMDAYQQQGIGTDEDVLKQAAMDCGNKCGFAQTTQAEGGGKKIPRPSGGGTKTSTTSPPNSSTTSAAASSSPWIWVAAAVAAAIGVVAILGPRRSLQNPLPDGVAKRLGVTKKDVDPRELAHGTKHELEHTTDRKIAQQIALDHLAEDPAYYKKLKKIERR